jgi:hypothetical protein
LSPEQAASVRDAQGRVKLLTHVGRRSRALIFFVLMWRDVHLYEVADQTYKGLFRLVTVIPLFLLFISNLAGAVAAITSPSHSAKKRLKAILNLDKLVEMLIIVFNFGRLTLFPSQYTPREIYIANTLHSVFFILQSQAFTRLTWCVGYISIYACDCAFVVWISWFSLLFFRDEFSESLAKPGTTSGMNMNPYSSYYGATEFASQDAYGNSQEPKHM